MKTLRLFSLFVFLALLLCSCQQSVPDKVSVRSSSTTNTVSRIVESSPETKSAAAEYVLNLNTKKFHKPKCSSVKQMKESNKKYVTKPREEIIADGYSPCGRCHP